MQRIFMEIAELRSILQQLKGQQKTFLTLSEAADYLGISYSDMSKKSSLNVITKYKPAKMVYYRREDLDNWILKHRIKSEEELTNEINQYDRKGGQCYGK